MTDHRRSLANKRNNVRSLRQEILMSKAELARRSGLSPLTIDRVESGHASRMDTKRKIILALGKALDQKVEVFPEFEDEEQEEEQERRASPDDGNNSE